MADFIVEPTSYFREANKPKDIVIKPAKANDSTEPIVRKLRIKAQGYDDKIITLTQGGKPVPPTPTPTS